MSKTKSRRPPKRALRARKDLQGQKRQPVKNGRRKAGTATAAFSDAGFHLLSRQLRSKTFMEIVTLSGLSNSTVIPQIMEMLNTEAKILQAIADLYLVMKAQPRYKAIKEPEWSVAQDPLEVLTWILRKLGPLAGGNPWTVDTWLGKNLERYCYTVFREFNGNRFQDRWFFIPLDFLPALKKRDEAAHDLIIDVVAMVVKHNKMALWDDDGDYSEVVNEFTHWDEHYQSLGNEVLDRQRESYKCGPAAQYLALIRRRMRKANMQEIAVRLRRYDAKSQRKEQLRWWLKTGLELAAGGENIFPFEYSPNYMQQDDVVSAYRYYKFVWCIHENDYVHVHAHQNMENASGTYPPMHFSITRPGGKGQDAPRTDKAGN